MQRTGDGWCEYRRCGGKGHREVAEGAVRRARVLLSIGKASWRVCDSCADLVERDRRTSNEPVQREPLRIVARSAEGDAPARGHEPRPAGPGRPPREPPGASKAASVADARMGDRRERLRQEKRKRSRDASEPIAALRLEKAERGREKRRRRAEWLAAHPPA